MTDDTTPRGPAAGGSRRVAIVIGSTRPSRICPDIAAWVLGAAQEESPLHDELIDLAAVNLPFLDEPLKAALGVEVPIARVGEPIESSFEGE